MRRLVVLHCEYKKELQAAMLRLGFSPDAGLSGVQFTVTIGAHVLSNIDDMDELYFLFAHLMDQGHRAYDSGLGIETDPEWITHGR